METYEVNAAYFVQKPLTESEFYHMMEIVLQKISSKNWLVTIDSDVTCTLQDICYIRHKGNTAVYYLKNQQHYIVTGHSEMNEDWGSIYPFFYQVSQEILINLYQVENVDNNSVILTNGHDVHLTKKGMKEFLAVYDQFCLRLMLEE